MVLIFFPNYFRDGLVSARFVLCKGVTDDGFKFFTHYTSRKGQEIVRFISITYQLKFN